MTFDPYIFEKALQQGRWLLIPAMLLAAGLCIAALFGVPRLLKNPIPTDIRNRPWAGKLPDRIRQMLADFLYGSSTLLRWTAQFSATLLVLAGLVLGSSAVLNILAGREMISLIGNADEDYTAAMGIAGGVLLCAGLLFAFFMRAAAQGEYALLDFIIYASTVMGFVLLAAGVAVYNYLALGFPGINYPLLFCLVTPSLSLFILGFKALMKK